MIHISRARSHLLLLGLAVSAAASHAQANPDSTRHRDDCRLASQTLSTGIPASKTPWALEVIPSCGDQGMVGTTVAAALTRLRSSIDTAQLLPLSRATFGLVDGSVYSAALTIAADGAASTTARAVNLLIVLTQLQPDAYVSFHDLLSAPASEYCPRGISNDAPRLEGPVALPADAKSRASALARALQNDTSSATLVRAAARCLLEAVDR